MSLCISPASPGKPFLRFEPKRLRCRQGPTSTVDWIKLCRMREPDPKRPDFSISVLSVSAFEKKPGRCSAFESPASSRDCGHCVTGHGKARPRPATPVLRYGLRRRTWRERLGDLRQWNSWTGRHGREAREGERRERRINSLRDDVRRTLQSASVLLRFFPQLLLALPGSAAVVSAGRSVARLQSRPR